VHTEDGFLKQLSRVAQTQEMKGNNTGCDFDMSRKKLFKHMHPTRLSCAGNSSSFARDKAPKPDLIPR